MNSIRLLHPCIVFLAMISGAGASTAYIEPSSHQEIIKKEQEIAPSVAEQLKPLADLLARGEGNYNSVNRGYAGDTPGGMIQLTGRRLSSYTVAEVIQLQRTSLFAVGRYQFIPRTLRFAVRTSSVEMTDAFDESAQDKLMAALIVYKRPDIFAYLQGSHDNLSLALDELAKEWASVEYRNSRSYYRGNGNRASISRTEAAQVLRFVKQRWNERGALP